jgi:hypothetical protein
MPAEMRDSVREGMRMARERKQATITLITASGRCDYTQAELEGMEQVALDRLMKLAGVVPSSNVVDFSARFAGQPTAAAADSAIPAPPDMGAAIKASAANRTGLTTATSIG